MKRIATVALLCCAVGCEGKLLPENSYTVYIDPAFGENVGDVYVALAEWQSTAEQYGQKLDLYPVVEYKLCDGICGPGEITIHPATITSIDADFGGNYLGYTIRDTDVDRADAWVGSNITDPVEWSTTLKHELGHEFALIHTGPGTIMFHQWGDQVSRTVSCADIQQYAHLRNQAGPECE